MKIDTVLGTRFTRLTLISKPSKDIWKFKCDCGQVMDRRPWDIFSGKVKSCGCWKRDATIARNKANAKYAGGLAQSPTMHSWCSMISRCFNKNVPHYPQYGGAGITVCEFIKATPLNLVILIGLRPKGTTLDRKNNLGGYSCGKCQECFESGWAFNVRWATPTEQGRNQRTNRLITIDGITKCLAEWSEISSVGESCIRLRIKRGWTGNRLLIPKAKFTTW